MDLFKSRLENRCFAHEKMLLSAAQLHRLIGAFDFGCLNKIISVRSFFWSCPISSANTSMIM